MEGAWVPFLVRELWSHMPCGVAPQKNGKLEFPGRVFFSSGIYHCKCSIALNRESPPSLKCVKKMVSHCFTHCRRNILSLFLHDPLLVHHMRLGGRDPWVGPSRAALRSLGSPCRVCVFPCTAITPFICHLNSHINYLTKIFIEVQYIWFTMLC